MHQEICRIRPDSRTACLFIHGIIGTPDHFLPFLPLLPEDMSFRTLLLDGHGAGVSDFARSSMEKWKEQVLAAVDELARDHDRVYLVGHSMGTLLSIRAALSRPEKIAGLFLMAVPIRPRLHPSAAVNSLRVIFRLYDEDNLHLRITRDSCSIRLTRNLFAYIGWIPRYLELFAEARAVRKLLPDLAVPCIAFQSGRDELVSRRAYRELLKHPQLRTELLAGSHHFEYTSEDRERLLSLFGQWISEA